MLGRVTRFWDFTPLGDKNTRMSEEAGHRMIDALRNDDSAKLISLIGSFRTPFAPMDYVVVCCGLNTLEKVFKKWIEKDFGLPRTEMVTSLVIFSVIARRIDVSRFLIAKGASVSMFHTLKRELDTEHQKLLKEFPGNYSSSMANEAGELFHKWKKHYQYISEMVELDDTLP